MASKLRPLVSGTSFFTKRKASAVITAKNRKFGPAPNALKCREGQCHDQVEQPDEITHSPTAPARMRSQKIAGSITHCTGPHDTANDAM